MPIDQEQIATTSERLWSDECSAVEGGIPMPPVVYEFNGGRRVFVEVE